ncbi:hypothetical protein LXA43DRAFT_893201, partial [Ganoderma leucocontextum]
PGTYTYSVFGKTNRWECSGSQLSSPLLDGWVTARSCPIATTSRARTGPATWAGRRRAR